MDVNGIDFFVLGYPRSGTSLLRMVLNGHPEIKVNPECSFLTHFFPEYRNRVFPLSSVEIQEFVTKVFDSRKFELWKLDYWEVLNHLIIRQPRNYGHLCALIYNLHGNKKAIKFLGDKNNVHIFYPDLLREIYPRCKFVYIIRDPRAVFSSLSLIKNKNIISKYKPKTPANVQDFCNQWHEAYKSLLEMNSSISNRIVVRYEDLIFSPKEVTLQVLDFIDESLTEVVRDADFSTLHLQGNDEPSELLDWKKLTQQPISRNAVDSWKKNMSSNVAKEIEANSISIMSKFKYIN